MDGIEHSLLPRAISDVPIRDFLCVNIQQIGKELHEKYHRFIQSQKSQNNEDAMYFFRKLGFLNTDIPKNHDETYYHYLRDVTRLFATQIEFLRKRKMIDYSSDNIQGFETYIKKPFIFLLQSAGVDFKKISLDKDSAYLDTTEKSIQNVLLAWQNKTIFERLIARVIGNELNVPVHCSKYIVVNSSDPLKYSLEFDNIFVFNNKICFVELKNGEIGRNKVFEFIGKAQAVEKYYNFRIDKLVIIGTRYKEPLFDEVEYKMPELGIFDVEDYRTNLSRFFAFIKT